MNKLRADHDRARIEWQFRKRKRALKLKLAQKGESGFSPQSNAETDADHQKSITSTK
jgi:hypothetical protein